MLEAVLKEHALSLPIEGPSDDSGKMSDDYLTIPNDLFRSMQDVASRPASAFFLGNAKLDESSEVAVGGIAGNGK